LPRPHQVRLHASEAGIRIVGEKRYGESGDIRLSELRRKGRLNKGEDRVINDGLMLRLASVDCSHLGFGVISGEDESWTGLIERLRDAKI